MSTLSTELEAVRPLRTQRRETLDAWGAALSKVLRAWSSGWAVLEGISTMGRACLAAESPAVSNIEHDWYEIATSDSGRLWFALAPAPASVAFRLAGAAPARVRDPSHVLKSAMFGASSLRTEMPNDSIAEQVAKAAWQDWGIRLRALASDTGATEALPLGQPQALPTTLLAAWSGSVHIELTWVGLRAHLVADPDFLDRWRQRQPISEHLEPPLRAMPPLSSLSEALAPSITRVAVELEAMDIDLGSLSSLRLGDVLRTPHRLDRALAVRRSDVSSGSTRPALCNAYLGKQGDFRVVELTAAAQS